MLSEFLAWEIGYVENLGKQHLIRKQKKKKETEIGGGGGDFFLACGGFWENV